MAEHDKHSGDSDDTCSCVHAHDHTLDGEPIHSQGDLLGKSEELPAVFSRSFQLELLQPVTGEELKDHLAEFIEHLKIWVAEKKYYTGHIKIFAQTGNGFTLWLSTTGKDINIKAAGSMAECKEPYSIHLTAIIFGAEDLALKEKCLELLRVRAPQKKGES
jgi:hypothetical protein